MPKQMNRPLPVVPPEEMPERALQIALELGSLETQLVGLQSLVQELRCQAQDQVPAEMFPIQAADKLRAIAAIEDQGRALSHKVWLLLEDLFGLRYDILEPYFPQEPASPRAEA